MLECYILYLSLIMSETSFNEITNNTRSVNTHHDDPKKTVTRHKGGGRTHLSPECHQVEEGDQKWAKFVSRSMWMLPYNIPLKRT